MAFVSFSIESGCCVVRVLRKLTYYSNGIHFGPTWMISMVHSENGVKHSEKQSLIGSIWPLNLNIKVNSF